MKYNQITDSIDGSLVGTNDSLSQLNYHLLRINQAIELNLQHQDVITQNADWLAKVQIASGVLTKLQKQIEALRKDEMDLLSKPGDTITESLEALGIDMPLFCLRMNMTTDATNALISGETLINTEIAYQLEQVLNIDAQFWLNREALYREKLNKLEN